MTQKEETVEMLNEIYQAASMGAQGSELLIEKAGDSSFTEKLHAYGSRYHKIKEEAAGMLAQRGETPREAGVREKAGLWMGVQMNTLIDKTPSHMAEMLIQGSTMGVIKSEKHKNTHPQADRQCFELEDRFLSLQQEHIDDMKQFLK